MENGEIHSKIHKILNIFFIKLKYIYIYIMTLSRMLIASGILFQVIDHLSEEKNEKNDLTCSIKINLTNME